MNDPAPITTNYEENLRYTYPLTADSLVLDCGGYEGNFARLINERYGCRVVVFEPVKAYFDNLEAAFAGNARILVRNVAVGSIDRTVPMRVHGAMSGTQELDPHDQIERAHVIRLSDWIGDQHIDLLKLNIEGMEYEVIADLMAECKMKQITHLQVQFHKRRESDDQLHRVMRHELLRTHRLVYDFPFVWEGYTVRDKWELYAGAATTSATI